jgi:hypothetical protein
MKTLLALLILIGSPIFGLSVAQAQLDDSFDLGLEPVTSEELSTEGRPEDKSTGATLNSGARQNRSIYIVNQASSGAKADAKTETEQNDTSLVGSRAEELRKNRQRAEVETELKATEKIEESRLKDERRRSDVLFGERFNNLEKSGEPATAPTPIYIAPVPAASPALDRQDLREELKSAMHEKDEHIKPHNKNTSYFIGLLGLTEFPKAVNNQGQGVVGIGLGIEAQEKILVEGMFQYAAYESQWEVAHPWPKDIEEYSGVGAIKFQFSRGTIRPLVGALASYSYRTVTDNFNILNRQASSSVLDAGVLGGAQIFLTDDFALGGEFRYLWNLTSKTGGSYQTFFPDEEPLDHMSHYILGVTGRFNF